MEQPKDGAPNSLIKVWM